VAAIVAAEVWLGCVKCAGPRDLTFLRPLARTRPFPGATGGQQDGERFVHEATALRVAVCAAGEAAVALLASMLRGKFAITNL
jgi:hypothetical protein